MFKRMVGIFVVFAFTSVAWFALGSSLVHRTWNSDRELRQRVAGLWGGEQNQVSPELHFVREVMIPETERVEDPQTKEVTVVTRVKTSLERTPLSIDSADVAVALGLEQRNKGLLWYATYEVDLRADYVYVHNNLHAGWLEIVYRFPDVEASYDDFEFLVDGVTDPSSMPVDRDGAKIVQRRIAVEPGDEVPFRIGYRSRGLDRWRYSFGANVNRVRDFTLEMRTDFAAIDFPAGTISPSDRRREGAGWTLRWRFEDLISGCEIGMEMPKRIDAGPLAATISYFAPVCLGFFFVWLFVITLLRGIDLHPMNYLFLGAAFFAFHLLFAYTVDHIAVAPAFLLSACVSVFLVVSYLRLVVGLRFAAVEAGIAQLIYLVLFSYAHFLQGFTGLFITIGSVGTLFALMQLTARFDWAERLGGKRPARTPGAPLPASD